MKSAILYFDTDFTAKLLLKNVRNGSVVVEGEHLVGKTTPFQLKSFFGMRPLYLVKFNCIYPASYEVKNFSNDLFLKKELVPMDLKWYEKGGAGYSPELLKTLSDVRFLKGMKKYSEGAAEWDVKRILSWVLGIIIFFAAGFLIFALIKGGIK
jgi:hypothetical protein